MIWTILYLPPILHAYSQVELLLCDTLAIGIAKPAVCFTYASRFLMKGYKFQRFVLDLVTSMVSHIWISFGIASISIFPYIYSSQIFFYQGYPVEKFKISY